MAQTTNNAQTASFCLVIQPDVQHKTASFCLVVQPEEGLQVSRPTVSLALEDLEAALA
ncbi:MAG: hypothetical protein WBC73_19645 [Phormidesmis sp.]